MIGTITTQRLWKHRLWGKFMKVAILESGKAFTAPETVRVFDSIDKAINAVPLNFKKIDGVSQVDFYAQTPDGDNWLSIKLHDVE